MFVTSEADDAAANAASAARVASSVDPRGNRSDLAAAATKHARKSVNELWERSSPLVAWFWVWIWTCRVAGFSVVHTLGALIGGYVVFGLFLFPGWPLLGCLLCFPIGVACHHVLRIDTPLNRWVFSLRCPGRTLGRPRCPMRRFCPQDEGFGALRALAKRSDAPTTTTTASPETAVAH